MKALVLFLVTCFSLPLLAQGDNCPGCFSTRKSSGYTIAELAKNVPTKPRQLEVYTSVVNELGVQDRWISHFEGEIMSSDNVAWLLDSLDYAQVSWEAGDGITVASFSADTVMWLDRPSYVYDEDNSSMKTKGPEHVALLDITRIFGFVDEFGNPYPVRILACLCCQNAVRDTRVFTTVSPKKPNVVGGGGSPYRAPAKTEPSGGVELDTFYTSRGDVIVYEVKKPTQWGEELYNQQQLAKQGVDTSGLFSQVGTTNINNSFNTTYISPSNAVQENSGGEYVYTRQKRRYVTYAEPETVVYTTPYVGNSYGVSFGIRTYGGYGGGYNYCPPTYHQAGVSGYTSNSSVPRSFNSGGRQYRLGLNGQYEAGSIGSATGPSSYGPRGF